MSVYMSVCMSAHMIEASMRNMSLSLSRGKWQ